MSTIAGVNVAAISKPKAEQMEQFSVSIGRAQDGTGKRVSIGTNRLPIKIQLLAKTLTLANSLFTALKADADGVVTIAPDAHIDLGNGAGVSVQALWIDRQKLMTYRNFDSWDIELNFEYVS